MCSIRVGVSIMNSEDGKYGVIVCPGCKSTKTVLLKNKTTECHQCGKKLELKKMKLHYQTDSRKEAGWAIGRLNAAMAGEDIPEEKEDIEDDPYVKASKKADIADDEKERLEIICKVIGEEMGGFETEDVRKVYELLGRKSSDDLEKKIKRLEGVYQPKEGVFKNI